MADINILIADNDTDALLIYGEFLTDAGYHVLTASGVRDARKILETHRIHLAILDLRLTDDSESDRSGLLLAQEIARSVPKIILTKWPTYRDARDALKLDSEVLPPAVDFLNKEDGLDALEQAVKQALLKYVRINRDLIIQRNDDHPISFLNLTELLKPSLSVDRQPHGAAELEDLFRRLFYEKSVIKIDRLLWHRDGRAALVAYAFAEGNVPESVVVVCGSNEQMAEEERRYRNFAPTAPGHNGTVLKQRAATQHYAAHCYALSGAELNNSTTLEDLYRTGPDRNLAAALTTMFSETLVEWHQEKRVPIEQQSFAELYETMFDHPNWDQLQEKLDNSISAIARQLPSLGVEVRRTAGRMIVDFGTQSFSYADPGPYLEHLLSELASGLLMKTPGVLLGSNILADRKGHAWLTDFAGAGLGPELWNYVSLESVVRFDWAEPCRLRWLHDLELLLVGHEFSKLDVSEIEAPLRKTVRTTQVIRKLASRLALKQQQQYHVGVLFHAVRRVAEHNSSVQLTDNELTRLGHMVFALGIILDRLVTKQNVPPVKKSDQAKGIHLDPTNRLVLIDGVKIQLRGQAYDLLRELYLHANESYPRSEIVERLFGEKYDETNESQSSRLNTAIRRLREKIEDDPDDPRFLLTELGVGYRLVPRGPDAWPKK